MATKKRLDPSIFNISEESIRAGHYTDKYFVRTRDILKRDDRHPKVLMQVSQKGNAIVCGTDEAIGIIKRCADRPDSITMMSLRDGEAAGPYETVMTIEGDYASFAHLETLYLGVLARQTKVATNTHRAVEAAGGKPLLFFSARFDHFLNQPGDGYAAHIGGAAGVSTDAQGMWFDQEGIGTVPHGLIAAYDGDTVIATRKFAEFMPDPVRVISLVDFDNDSVKTSLEVAKALGKRLWGVRLDTAETLIDRSVVPQMSDFAPTGVNEVLVRNVRAALDTEGFSYVKVVVSGGFTAEKIARFEASNVPVDAYGVGSSLLTGTFHYTADVVMVNGRPCAKVGRHYRPNSRLKLVE
ncbi:MAG TPA: quinolinate phosphoribosyl transferase [bacterium]|nr:quinolinate phosphoribosyl transferase [bacterium]